MEELTKLSQWIALKKLAQDFKGSAYNAFSQNSYNAEACNIKLNYHNQHISPQILNALFDLAETHKLKEKIHGLMRGDCVNLSENKPALHTALRMLPSESLYIDEKNILDDVFAAKHKMQKIAEKIRAKQWYGYSGEPITDIVNIGIGGSDLGPRFCINAFADLVSDELNYHFISDADPHAFKNCVAKLKPQTTLFIISSKSFTTQETLFNARKAKSWIGDEDRFPLHFIAVTANIVKAQQFGIKTILPIWDWVGGRYSLCSAINLITVIAIGMDNFNQLLLGANSMDNHFKHAEFANNLPVILALIGIWNNNFLDIHNLLLLTYSQRLDELVPYIQQLDMESNGKSVNKQNLPTDYATGLLVWGGPGNQAQHSYYQLICQGTHKIAVDMISVNLFDGQMLNDMCLDKIRVLTQGVANSVKSTANIYGGVPLNHICLADYSPFTIGALIALYEHKVFVQSVIWNINPFDQPGVESAKCDRMVVSN